MGKKARFPCSPGKGQGQHLPVEETPLLNVGGSVAGGQNPKVPKKKVAGSRLWMRFDSSGNSEVMECDRNMIMRRVSIPARDLRILGPVFSHSSNIVAREKAMVVNLEFIKAIVTAEEVFLLDPLDHDVLPFVDQLRQQLPLKSSLRLQDNTYKGTSPGQWLPVPEAAEGLQRELPFEFRVLEIALEVVCTSMDSKVAELERDAYPVLDELAKNVSTRNLERVRILKSNLTRLLARVQKVRDELEHLLDDDEDMADLYLTRKYLQSQHLEASVMSGGQNTLAIFPSFAHINSNQLSNTNSNQLSNTNSNLMSNSSFVASAGGDDDDVEDLEMLLEAYFMQVDGTRNKILSVREYIDDTEDYVNIQLDNKRNELIQFQLTLTVASFAIGLATFIAGVFGMNIPCPLYDVHGLFWPFTGSFLSVCIIFFFVVLGYAHWKGLLGT